MLGGYRIAINVITGVLGNSEHCLDWTDLRLETCSTGSGRAECEWSSPPGLPPLANISPLFTPHKFGLILPVAVKQHHAISNLYSIYDELYSARRNNVNISMQYLEKNVFGGLDNFFMIIF